VKQVLRETVLRERLPAVLDTFGRIFRVPETMAVSTATALVSSEIMFLVNLALVSMATGKRKVVLVPTVKGQAVWSILGQMVVWSENGPAFDDSSRDLIVATLITTDPIS
jgi:hypothetical protein